MTQRDRDRLRTLRKIVEEPDIAPGPGAPGFGTGRRPGFGDSFESAVAQFSIRSVFRSRQHRMIFAFYLGVVFSILILVSGGAGPDLGRERRRPLA